MIATIRLSALSSNDPIEKLHLGIQNVTLRKKMINAVIRNPIYNEAINTNSAQHAIQRKTALLFA